MRISILAAMIALLTGGTVSAQYHPYAVPASLSAPAYVPYYQARNTLPQPTELPQPQAERAPATPPTGGPLFEGQMSRALDGESIIDPGSEYVFQDDPGYLGEAGYVPGVVSGNWFVGVSGLVMTRANDDFVDLTFDATPGGSEPVLLRTNDSFDWSGGSQVDLGYRVGCRTWLAATYWWLDPMESSGMVTDPTGQLNSIFDFRSLDFSPTETVNDLYNGARAQAVWRSSEFHNVELNVLNSPVWCPCGCIRVSWLAGARYFQFRDAMLFGTAHDFTEFGVSPAYDAYYNIKVQNHLIGAQLGFRLDWRATCRLTAFVAPKVGIYNNHITSRQAIYNGLGEYAYRFADGAVANIRSDENCFAVLTEIDLGLNYQVTCNLSIYGGYRLVSAAGVALATEQVPYLADDFRAISEIDNTGNVFLHGAFAGVLLRF